MPQRRAGGKVLDGDLGRSTTIAHIEAAIASRWWRKDTALQISGLEKLPLGVAAGFGVYQVSGEWIRDNLDVTFGTGGHGLVHTFIPLSEVWVDPLRESASSITFHEILEFKYMMHEGVDYWEAHQKALDDQRGRTISPSNLENELNDVIRKRFLRRLVYHG